MSEQNRNTFELSERTKQKLISFVVLLLMFILFWNMLNLVLLTFIFTFLFYHLMRVIQRRNRKVLPFMVPDWVVVVLIYVCFLFLLSAVSVELAPRVVEQLGEIANAIVTFDMEALEALLGSRTAALVDSVDIDSYLSQAGSLMAMGLSRVTGFGVYLFLSLLLSLLLLLEKGKIALFARQIQLSPIGYIYEYLYKFGSSFARTFGKVMKVQGTIALINSIVSMLLLAILGFPQILGLGVMIFFLGLIPVAGVIISFVPLGIIAFNLGGVSKVILVLSMIIFIHTLEAYILNPKLMSARTELPVCFVFVILVMGEHYLGVWGLLIGVPIFVFLMDMAGVDYSGIAKKRRRRKKEEPEAAG
ncbi:MAG: AI-2E family transporter [Bacillota bacterium]|nr:AI-2E family transporter [Bacillota bacterium]